MPKEKTTETARMKGRRMAARMLSEMERVAAYEASITGMNPHNLFAEWRYKGEPQDNIVLRYLQRAAAQGDECVAGFCSVLSSELSDVEAGAGLSRPGIFMRVTEQEINEGDTPTREQILREANHSGIALH